MPQWREHPEYDEAYAEGYRLVVFSLDGSWWVTTHDPEGDTTSWDEPFDSCAEARAAAIAFVRSR